MIRAKNQEKFERYVKDLWTYLKTTLKETHPNECKDLNHFLLRTKKSMEATELMRTTLRNISPYIDYISRKDEFIFTPEFGDVKTKPLQFLPGFDFRKVWKKTNLTNEQKKIIFRYIEFLYIQSSLALGKNRDKVNELVEAIKMEQEITREAEENPNAFGDADEGGDFSSIFGDDETLMELVNDLKDELNLEETLGGMLGGIQIQPGQNPMQAIQQMSNNPQMAEMMRLIAGKMESKMKEKGITQEDLMKSAENLKTNLAKNVSKMPGGAQIKKMLNNLDVDSLAKQMQQQEQQLPNPFLQQQSGPDMDQLMAQLMGGQQQAGQMPPQLQQMFQQLGQMHTEEVPTQNDEQAENDQELDKQ